MAAGTQRRMAHPLAGVYGNRLNVGFYFHTFVTTTSGTISTAAGDTAAISGLTITKTAAETGRYTIQTPTPHKSLLSVRATLIGADDAAYGAVTLGLIPIVRDNDITSDGTFEVQFIGTNAGWADAEIADGASVMLEVVVDG